MRIYWFRLFLSIGGFIGAAIMLRRVVLDARLFRLSGRNGEASLIYESLRRISRSAVLVFVVTGWSAFYRPDDMSRAHGLDAVLIVLLIGGWVWLIVKVYTVRREAERMVAERLRQRTVKDQ